MATDEVATAGGGGKAGGSGLSRCLTGAAADAVAYQAQAAILVGGAGVAESGRARLARFGTGPGCPTDEPRPTVDVFAAGLPLFTGDGVVVSDWRARSEKHSEQGCPGAGHAQRPAILRWGEAYPSCGLMCSATVEIARSGPFPDKFDFDLR